MGRTRTSIEIDDEYVAVVMKRYRLHSKTEAVNLALRLLAGRQMSLDEALAMEGARAIRKIPRDVDP
jgi:Arc/MetJ family transcription regulator